MKEEGAQASCSLLSSSLLCFSASSLFLRSSSSSLPLLCSSSDLLLLFAPSCPPVSCMNCWVVGVPPMCTLLLDVMKVLLLLLLLEEKMLDCCSVMKLSGFHTDSTDSLTPPGILRIETLLLRCNWNISSFKSFCIHDTKLIINLLNVKTFSSHVQV